jgi:hypothetical protein
MDYPRLDFGKYRGYRLDQVPRSYLEWMIRECRCASPWLRKQAEALLAEETRDAEQSVPAVSWPSLIRDWYRGLAMEFHPDRGGSVEAMRAINEAHDRLRKLVGT